MKTHKLKDMAKGWFVGNFDPTLHKTEEFEVAVKEYGQGESEEYHHHKVAQEITVVVTGEVEMNDEKFVRGDIIVLDPNEGTSFTALTDAVITVVKVPCAKGDKYLGGAS